MTRDPWHYPRPALAAEFLRRFDPGPASALTLFAERRFGKTAFLVNDAAPASLIAGLQPVYIDLWTHRKDPGRAIADGFENAARKVADPKYTYGSLLGRLGDEVDSVGAFGFSVGLRSRSAPAPSGGDETLSRIAFWSGQLVAACKRPVVLMIDEVQTLGNAKDGGDVASALRAALQQAGRMAMRPIFTGSSRDGLQRMFNVYNAAFYQFGSSADFPALDSGIAGFFAARLRESSGIVVDPSALLDAFDDLGRRPGPFREMVEAMDKARDPNVERHLQRQIGALHAAADARAALAQLTPLDRGVLGRIVMGESLFGREAKRALAESLKLDAVNPNSINESLTKLRGRGIVTRMARGDYRIEDRDLEVFLSGGSPLPSAAAALGEGDRPRPNTAYVGRIEVVDGDRVVQRINDGRMVAHSLASLYKLGGGLRAALGSAEPVSIRYADNTLGQVTTAGVEIDKQRGPKR